MIKLKKNAIVLFAGDSITDGGRSRNMDLNHHLGHGYQYMLSSRMSLENIDATPKFINKGFSGGGINMLYEVWYEQVLKYKPDVISIYIGVNDLFKSINGLTEANVNRYEQVYDLLISDTVNFLPDVKLVLVEPIFAITYNTKNYVEYSPHILCEKEFIPLNISDSEQKKKTYRAEIAKFQEVVKKLSKKYGAVFVPLQDEFDKYLEKCQTEYLLWDGVHPTIAGHGIIAKQWYRCVDEAGIIA